MGVCGPLGAEEGDGERALRQCVLSTRARTASESSADSSSVEEAEPEMESSSSVSDGEYDHITFVSILRDKRITHHPQAWQTGSR